MKKTFLFLVFAGILFSMNAQTMFQLKFDEYQYMDRNIGVMGGQMKLPNGNAMVIMGGLNDLDGMNNYFNLFGGKLIIDSLDMGLDGTQKIVLRREDGQDFYNLFPTISARLIPIDRTENENNDIKGFYKYEDQ